MKLFDYFFSYSIILLPFALISGPFLPDLLVSVSALFFIFFTITKKIFRFFFLNKFSIFFFLWFFYLIIRSITSEFPELSLSSSLFYFRFYIFSLVIFYICLKKDNTIKYFTLSLLFAFMLLIFDGFFQFYFGYNLIGLTTNGDRISSFFGEEKILGSYLSRLIPILFGLIVLIYDKNKYLPYILVILLFLVDVLIFISGDRSAFFNLIIFTLAVILLNQRFNLLRFFTFVISLIFIFFISMNFDNIRDRMINKTLSEFTINSNQSEGNISNIDEFISNKFSFNFFTLSHTKIYLTSFYIFKDNILFGTGSKTFREVCKRNEYLFFDGCQTHPHNTYLQLLSETGLMGAMPIIFIFITIIFIFIKILYFKYVHKKIIVSEFSVYLIVSIFITLWPLIPTGNFFNNWLSVIYYMPLGFLLYDNRKLFNEKMINENIH